MAQRYSNPIRTAAAAASGASVTPSTAIAPNKYIGGAMSPPAIASCVASRAENQDGHRQRQRQQRQQHSAASRAEREPGADRARPGSSRNCQAPARPPRRHIASPGTPSASRRNRRGQRQRQAGQQPVRAGLREQHPCQRLPRQRELLERPILPRRRGTGTRAPAARITTRRSTRHPAQRLAVATFPGLMSGETASPRS